MPRNPNAVCIGRMTCATPGCGERAAMYQNSKLYLYARCPACGCNQSNGAPTQVHFWQHLEPLPGAVIRRPRNVPESAGDIGCALTGAAPAAVIEPERVPEPEPVKQVQEPVHVPEPEPVRQVQEGKKKGSAAGVVLLVVGGLLAALAGGSVMASNQG